MGVYRRNDVLWISYTFEGQRYFESAGTLDRRAAETLYRERKRNGPAAPRATDPVLTIEAYAKTWIARRTEAGVRTVAKEEGAIDRWLVPDLGSRPLAEVTRNDVREIIAKASTTPRKDKDAPMAPRSVLHVYGAIRAMFADAVADGLLAATPCTLRTKRGELPKKRDADPTWRASSIYSRSEAEGLLADPRIPPDRRVIYALALLGGLRIGEIIARRWRDFDTDAAPLPRLLVATQHDDRETKTETPREVPVHPTLASVLATWKRTGWPMLFGRHPTPDDRIVPSRAGVDRLRSGPESAKRLKEDLERVGLRSDGRSLHAMRATFITLAQTDGARREILEAVTHAGRRDVFSGYSRWPWEALCVEVAKLRVELHEGRVIALPLKRAASAENDVPARASGDATSPFGAETVTVGVTVGSQATVFARKGVTPRGLEPRLPA